jgi:hypothetical protein
MKQLHFSRRVLSLTVVCAAALLGACGGGETSLTPSESFVSRMATETPVAGSLPATASLAKRASVVTITNNQLFQWAQLQYPELFGSAAPNIFANLLFNGQLFDVREFSGGAYLGISQGRVFGLGPFTNGQLVDFGVAQAYSAQVCGRINCSGTGSLGSGTGTLIETAGLAIVALNRAQFTLDVIDAAFEVAINSRDIPGTYSCIYSGTITYTKTASNYIFSVVNCDTIVAGERILLQSGSIRFENPIVQTTFVAPSTIGFFLTSAVVTFNNATFIESGVPSSFAGTINQSATVTSPTTAIARGTSARIAVQRAGRTDSYSNIDITTIATLFSGNTVTGGSFNFSSPRAPGDLSFNVSALTITVSSADGSKLKLTKSNNFDYTLERSLSGSISETTTGTVASGPLAFAIAKALQ